MLYGNVHAISSRTLFPATLSHVLTGPLHGQRERQRQKPEGQAQRPATTSTLQENCETSLLVAAWNPCVPGVQIVLGNSLSIKGAGRSHIGPRLTWRLRPHAEKAPQHCLRQPVPAINAPGCKHKRKGISSSWPSTPRAPKRAANNNPNTVACLWPKLFPNAHLVAYHGCSRV